jgi:hypothetical protein
VNSWWNNLRPFEQRVVVVVGAACFVVLNIWFIFPHFSDWGRVKARMAKSQQTLEIFRKALAQEPLFRAKIKELEKAGSSVPTQDQELHFENTITMLAAQSHVVPSTGRMSTRTNDPFFVEKSQLISFTAGEQDLVNFLYSLGTSDSMIRVRDLGLHPDPPRQQLAATLKVVASYQRKPPAKPAATAPQPAATAPPPAAAAAKPALARTNPPTAKPGGPVSKATVTNQPPRVPAPGAKPSTTTNKSGFNPAKKP